MAKPGDGRTWVGFDLGGTKMLSVLFDDAMHPIARERKRTRGHEGPESGLRRIIEQIEKLLMEAGVGKERLAGIGIGCPGPLDLDRGVILEMPNLGWKNVRLGNVLAEAFGCPVTLINDVDAGVYAESRFGAGQGGRCVVGAFAGTGIGGGAVYRGEILRGARGSCFEIGHIPVSMNGALCGCGRRGCLEATAGRLAISAQAAMAAYRGEAPNLMRLAGTNLAEIRSQVLAQAIAHGDQVIEQIVRQAAATIGWALAGVVNLLAPDIIVLGGGLVEDMPALFKGEVEQALKAQVMPALSNTFTVATAKLAGDATSVGAAAWARAEHPPLEAVTRRAAKGG